LSLEDHLRTLEKQGETEKPLKTYEIKQENGTLLANIEAELTYDFDDDGGDPDDDFFK
jgi:toluene monooxygenase system ferredoxin subunit